MAHLIMHGEAPLASGDELTPSLEYTLDEPNPLHADDLVERDQPTPSSDEKIDTPPESPTPEGDNSTTLERQPIYAQVLPKADRPPKNEKPEEPKEKDKDSESDSDKEKNDDSSSSSDDDKGKDKKKKDKKDKDKEEPKKSDKPKTIKVKYRVDKGMPKHRSRCVACGCARICCVENFVSLWIILFILIQAGPLAVLVLDFLGVNSHGTTFSRYITEWNMEPAVCRVTELEIENLPSCDCFFTNTRCNATISEYGCMRVKTQIFIYNHTGPISNSTILWKSDREYVLNKYGSQCFNLDICKINKNKPWHEYRNQTIRDEVILRNKTGEDEGFVCYYKETDTDSYIAIMEMGTSIWQVLLWFFLPLLGILICWLIILICMCWYCCPPGKYITRVRKKNSGGNYHEVVSAEQEEGSLEHDPHVVKEALYVDDVGAHRTWPVTSPSAACDV